MKTQEIVIEPARASDAAALAALLRASGLPHENVGPHLRHFLVARRDGELVGTIGAEVHVPDALLRSLAVAPSSRGSGLGRELVRRLEAVAGEWGVERWWLLTTTAEAFFARGGFSVAARSTAPETIRRTGQFTGGCSCSALCMTRARKGPA